MSAPAWVLAPNPGCLAAAAACATAGPRLRPSVASGMLALVAPAQRGITSAPPLPPPPPTPPPTHPPTPHPPPTPTPLPPTPLPPPHPPTHPYCRYHNVTSCGKLHSLMGSSSSSRVGAVGHAGFTFGTGTEHGGWCMRWSAYPASACMPAEEMQKEQPPHTEELQQRVQAALGLPPEHQVLVCGIVPSCTCASFLEPSCGVASKGCLPRDCMARQLSSSA